MLSNLESSAVATGLEKVSFHPNPKEEQCQRMNYWTTELISHGFSSKWTKKFQMFKLNLEKAEEPETKYCQHLLDHRES